MVMQWSQFGPSWMSYFLKCGANPKSTCAVNGELRLLPWKAEISPFKRTISTTFPNNENDWGFRNYILMEDLLDPAKGYVNPNTFSVKLQLQLSADLPVEIE
ncbi:ubiquitin carboxyl-terminal hydrolase 7-like [Paramacrobiotus metropolitanus]|uniref:ubiquitin carboxyl-terminal hydrolase 7-like n=1 Tax=Paramacrobiotus metropolitanus TaxID=2943436 RepID=UPI0024456F80|nr:ubiquitin carboxyl-terminal hydrolase 7-like [Paramacrobiotus metropolitanus]